MRLPLLLVLWFLLCSLLSPLPAQDGFFPVIGGLPADSGFALGAGYQKQRLARGVLDFRAHATGSVKLYEHLELHLDAPRLAEERFFAEFSTRYRNYPQENFWGLGPEVDESRRTNFRLEDLLITGAGGFRPLKRLRIGAMAGYLRANAGPGKDKATLSVERLFTPAEVPGLVEQPDYSLFGAFADFDSRDSKSDPRAGGFYQARWTYFDDRDFNRFSFHRYEIELQHFLPTHAKRGAFATRGLLSLTGTSPGQGVPFFMQQTVGGNSDLRGYRQYRFRDKNRLVFNLEYRWEVMQYFDLVAFGDAGRVFSRRSDVGLDDLRGSVGVGGRFKFRERVWLGLDVAHSTEGVRLWLRGSNIF